MDIKLIKDSIKSFKDAHREPADETAVEELTIYAHNTKEIYDRYINPICKNLARKKAKGTYDETLAIKGMKCAADGASELYNKEFGFKFNPATREEAAKKLLELYEDYIDELAEEIKAKKTKDTNEAVLFYIDGEIRSASTKEYETFLETGVENARWTNWTKSGFESFDDVIKYLRKYCGDCTIYTAAENKMTHDSKVVEEGDYIIAYKGGYRYVSRNYIMVEDKRKAARFATEEEAKEFLGNDANENYQIVKDVQEVKDEQIIMVEYLASPKTQAKEIEKLIKLGAKVEDFGGLKKVIVSADALAKVFEISLGDVIDATNKPMSAVRLAENYDTEKAEDKEINDTEKNPLEDISNPTFEVDGDVYGVEYKDGKLYAGTITNVGPMHTFEIDYDWDLDVDVNLQNLWDKINEEQVDKIEDSCKDEESAIKLKLTKRKNVYDEYVVRVYKDGKYNEDATYYSDDWEDAVGTLMSMAEQYKLEIKEQGNGYVAE